MIHPVFQLIASRPQLLAEHAAGYGELLSAEVSRVKSAWQRRVLLLVTVSVMPRELVVVVMLFAIVQLHSAHRLHRSIDARLRQIDSSLLAKIPPHSRVLPLLDISHGEWRDFLVHRIGNYVVLRDSYSPHVFVVRGQHPLRHHPWGDQREVTNLQVTPQEWHFYDYVLLQTDKPQLAQTLTAHLEPIAAQDVFQLLRVVKPTEAAGTLSP